MSAWKISVKALPEVNTVVYYYVLDIIEKKGYLWLATDGGGINRLELRNEKFSNLYHIAGDENSLPVNSITVLYKDSNECLWAGSVRGGEYMYPFEARHAPCKMLFGQEKKRFNCILG